MENLDAAVSPRPAFQRGLVCLSSLLAAVQQEGRRFDDLELLCRSWPDLVCFMSGFILFR